MVIGKSKRIVNCNRLKSNGESVKNIEIRGISTSLYLLIVVASIKFRDDFITTLSGEYQLFKLRCVIAFQMVPKS
jgi:hypothetical protein